MNYGSPAPESHGQGGRGAPWIGVPSLGVTENTPVGGVAATRLGFVLSGCLCATVLAWNEVRSEIGVEKKTTTTTNKCHHKEYFNPLEGLCF